MFLFFSIKLTYVRFSTLPLLPQNPTYTPVRIIKRDLDTSALVNLFCFYLSA